MAEKKKTKGRKKSNKGKDVVVSEDAVKNGRCAIQVQCRE